jgi:hypothetical protein
VVAGSAIILSVMLIASAVGDEPDEPSAPPGLAATVRAIVPADALTSIVWTGKRLRVGVAADLADWHAKLQAAAPGAPLDVVLEAHPSLAALERLAAQVEEMAHEFGAPLTTIGVSESDHVVEVGLDSLEATASRKLARSFADRPVQFYAEPIDGG